MALGWSPRPACSRWTSSLSSERRPFKRYDPARYVATLAYRSADRLPWDLAAAPAGKALMLDTTVYIDAQRGKLPDDLAARIGSAHIRHSAVALGEIAANTGLLHPSHPGTAMVNGIVRNIVANADTIRTAAPSAEAWLEASVLSGILARTQGFDRADRRKLLNDALIFLSAAEEDAILISRNVRDMDLLLQMRPDVLVVLYAQKS